MADNTRRPKRTPAPTRYHRVPPATTITQADVRRADIARAIGLLTTALNLMRDTAPATAAAIRRCLKSAEGAWRHADARRWQLWREKGMPSQ
jgi:hypothetical protein